MPNKQHVHYIEETLDIHYTNLTRLAQSRLPPRILPHQYQPFPSTYPHLITSKALITTPEMADLDATTPRVFIARHGTPLRLPKRFFILIQEQAKPNGPKTGATPAPQNSSLLQTARHKSQAQHRISSDPKNSSIRSGL